MKFYPANRALFSHHSLKSMEHHSCHVVAHLLHTCSSAKIGVSLGVSLGVSFPGTKPKQALFFMNIQLQRDIFSSVEEHGT
jgi:hypothetical protein